LTSTTMMSSMTDREGLENEVHRLKLQWIMAKDEAERRKISEEIRRRIRLGQTR
jgi:hypothetical protein